MLPRPGPKAIATCTVCQKTGHKAEGCWFGAENKIVTNTSISSAESSYSLTCQLPASCVPIASETACTTTLYKGYSTTTAALVTTLSLRQRAKTAVLDQMFVPGTKEFIPLFNPWL